MFGGLNDFFTWAVARAQAAAMKSEALQAKQLSGVFLCCYYG